MADEGTAPRFHSGPVRLVKSLLFHRLQYLVSRRSHNHFVIEKRRQKSRRLIPAEVVLG